MNFKQGKAFLLWEALAAILFLVLFLASPFIVLSLEKIK